MKCFLPVLCVCTIVFSGCRPDESRQAEIERREIVLEQDVKTIYDRIGSLQTSVADMVKKLGDSADSKSVNALSAKVDAVDNQMGSLKSEINTFVQKAHDSDTSIRNELKKINTSMVDLQERVKALESVAKAVIEIANENAKPACLYSRGYGSGVKCQCKGFVSSDNMFSSQCSGCGHDMRCHTRDKNGYPIK